MKKMIIALVIVLALIAGLVSYYEIQKKDTGKVNTPVVISQTGEPEDTEEEDTEQQEAAPLKSLDYDAVYASCDPEAVVMNVDGTEVTWDEYYYWLEYFAESAEYYMQMYSYYGYPVSWDEYAPLIVENTGTQIKSLIAVEKFAEEKGVELTDEEQKEIEDGIVSAVEEQYGGDNAENRAAYFASMGVSEEMYNRLMKINYLYQDCFKAVYGEDAARVSDEDAVKWLEDNRYMYASHILFATLDLGTMEDLGENEKAEKEELANKVAKELQAITDKEELVKRFKELKEEYCEDTGKSVYPDGYMFLTGTMVEEFENGYKSLEDYQVSDPILSTYGYHVMLRLPLSADAVIEYSDDGQPLNARQKFANDAYGKEMDGYTESLKTEEFDGIKNLNLLDYLAD